MNNKKGAALPLSGREYDTRFILKSELNRYLYSGTGSDRKYNARILLT